MKTGSFKLLGCEEVVVVVVVVGGGAVVGVGGHIFSTPVFLINISQK